MTQTDLAKAINSSQRAISHYESVAEFPPAGVVIQLAEVFGLTTDELLGAKPMRPSDSPLSDPKIRRFWNRFEKIIELPEKDQRAVWRMVDAMAIAREAQ